MNGFLIATVAPLLWAISGYIDKYLITKYFKNGGVGALMIFSSLIGLFLLPIIFLIEPTVIDLDWSYTGVLCLNGFLYLTALLPCLHAIKNDEVSVVLPLYQTVPVFSWILALFFLNEALTEKQLLAAGFIIFGAMLISVDSSSNKTKFKSKVFFLILLSSFLVALNSFIFKLIAIQTTFWTTSFWEYVGFSIFAVFLFLIKPYRQQFFYVLKDNKVTVLTINGINEILNIIGKIVMNFATILMPLALAWIINGLQPFFILLFGIFLAIFFPKLTDESLNKKHIFQKIIAISLMFLGVYLLNM